MRMLLKIVKTIGRYRVDDRATDRVTLSAPWSKIKLYKVEHQLTWEEVQTS